MYKVHSIGTGVPHSTRERTVDINKLPEVSGIKGDGTYKFIVVTMVDEVGATRVILRAGEVDLSADIDTVLKHRQLLQALNDEVEGELRHEKPGGGWLEVRGNDIQIFGRSGDYGPEPDRKATAAMLHRAFPSADVSIDE